MVDVLAYQLAHEIFLDDLTMKGAEENFILKSVNFEQNLRRVQLVRELGNEANNDPELLKLDTQGDGICFVGYLFETEAPSFQWRHPE